MGNEKNLDLEWMQMSLRYSLSWHKTPLSSTEYPMGINYHYKNMKLI